MDRRDCCDTAEAVFGAGTGLLPHRPWAGPQQGGYFCTPKGLTVLGWEGVDGIHYGRIRGYGDMVFAVNPMPAGEQHVRPLAGSFRDFLRLLLACGSTTTLEQAGDWTREQFDTYLRAPENAVTPDAQAVLERIASAFRLTPMEDPFPTSRAYRHPLTAASCTIPTNITNAGNF